MKGWEGKGRGFGFIRVKTRKDGRGKERQIKLK